MDYPSSEACAPFAVAFAPVLTGGAGSEFSGRPFKLRQFDPMFHGEDRAGEPSGAETDKRT